MKQLLIFLILGCLPEFLFTQDDPLALFNKGNDLMAAKEYQNAIYAYDKAIELDPNLYYIYASRAEAKVELGDYKSALADYNSYKKLVEDLNLLGDPDIMEKRQKLINLFPSTAAVAANGAPDTDLESAIVINSNEQLKALYYRGKLKYESNDLLSALRDFTAAIQADSSFVDAYNARGYTYLKMRDMQAAYNDFGQAIFLNPNLYSAYVGRGEVKDKLRNFTSAIEDYNAAIKLAPGKYNAYYNRALSWFNQKNYTKAEEDFSTVIKLNAKHEKAFFNRGITKVNLRRSTEACLDFKMAQSLGHNHAVEYVNRFCK